MARATRGRRRAAARLAVRRPRRCVPPPIDGGLQPPHLAGRRRRRAAIVLRVLDPAVSAAGLGIPPEQEIDEHAAGGRQPAPAPRVIEVLPDVPALVLEFLPGRTLRRRRRARRRPRSDGSRPPAAGCTPGRAFGNDFDIFAKRRELFDVCAAARPAVPDGYHDHGCPRWTRSRRRSPIRPLPAVPCHNDLLPENFIDVAGDGPHHRLPAVRQQRPGFRAGRHRGRGRLRPRPDGGARRRVLRTGARAGAARPGAAQPDRCPT